MNNWHPIETAPKDEDINILVFRSHEGFEENGIQIENAKNSRFYDYNGFTHRMPLPNPPQINKE